MTKNESREFTERFDAMDARFDAMDVRHLLEVVAEDVAGVTRTLEALRLEMAAGFREQREFVQTLFRELDHRVTRLEEGLSS